MKNNKFLVNFFIFLLFICSNLIQAESENRRLMPFQQTNTIKGCILISKKLEKMPEFRIFFEGKQTISDKDGFYTIPLDDTVFDSFSILFCDNIKQNFDKINTIQNLSIDSQKPYKLIHFERSFESDNQWEQSDMSIDDTNFVIPKNCLVIQINPNLVDHVENWKIKMPKNFIPLPRVVLKQNLEEKDLSRESAKSLLNSIDSRVFHEPIKSIKKEFDKDKKICAQLVLPE